MHRIVILGAGFAGLRVARALRGRRGFDVTIVDRQNFTLFTPMLPEVSSASIEPRHIAQPLRVALRDTARIVVGSVTSADLERRTLALEPGADGVGRELPFDTLVVAAGTETSTHHVPGVEQHGFPLKTIRDAMRLRNQTIDMLDRAALVTDPAERDRALTFVIVGGGFTGVEAAGELRGFLDETRGFYPELDGRMRVVLIGGHGRLLGQLPEKFGTAARRMFARRDIEVMLDDDAAAIDEAGITLHSGRRIEARTVVWSAGVRPAPVAARLGLPLTEHGALKVNADFSVPGVRNVWALGDCAHIPKVNGGSYAATAQNAVRQGPLLARNLEASLAGRRTRPFRYRSLGMMASLGHREGLADLGPGIMLTGVPAWLLWRTYYLSQLPGLARKIRVALDWTLAMFFRGDIASIR